MNGEYYHVFNRGVDKRDLFESDADRIKFFKKLLVGFPDDRDSGVDVISYCLMDNHYHLFLKQNKNGGISKFMHALGMGYSHYFNKTRDRTGKLFASSFKAVPIKSEAHYMHIVRYIHLNILDRHMPGWRIDGIQDVDSAMALLDDYAWCDFGNSKWPKDFILSLFVTMEEYRAFLIEWIRCPAPHLVVNH